LLITKDIRNSEINNIFKFKFEDNNIHIPIK